MDAKRNFTESFEVKVISASIYHKDDKRYVKLVFDTSFPGISRNDNDEYVETSINAVTFPYHVFMYKMEQTLKGFKLYVSAWEEKRGYAYTGTALSAFLADAKVRLVRTKHTPEDTYIDADGFERHYAGVKYDTDICIVALAKRAQDAFNSTYADLL